MKKAKWFAVFCVLTICLALCACGDKADKEMGAEVLKFTLLEDKTYAVSAAEDLYSCDDIHLRIPSEYKGKAVTTIAVSAFAKLYGLTSVTVPDSVTNIGASAFSDCSSLISITIPDSVTSIGDNMFYGCTGLTSITIPDSVTSIERSAFSNTAYYNNDANWTDDVLYIGNHLIAAKESLSGAYAIKEGTRCIARAAFRGCSSLTSITIPDGVTEIGYAAFSGCSSLTSITIPDGVASIGNYAFSGCSSLTDIYYDGTYEQWNAIEKDSNWIVSHINYTVHCTDGDYSRYE